MKPSTAFDVIGGPLLAALLILLWWMETASPLRRRIQPRSDRLRTNAGMTANALLTIRLAFLPVVLAVAVRAARARLGVTHLWPGPPILGAMLAFVLLDYTTYIWHRLNHRIPFLWRFHSVHHTDLDLDVTTAFRFHSGELLLSIVYRTAQVIAIGVGPIQLLVYDIAMDAATAFHHSNWRLPLRLERGLSRVLVTPRMHGIHHSIVERETNSNWSVIFSWWDRLHGTLRLDVPQDRITIGIPAYRRPRELTVWTLLEMPFRRQRDAWRLPDGTHPDRIAAGGHRHLAP